MDHILPSSERLRLFTAFLLSLSRAFAKGLLPTCANRVERTRASRAEEANPRLSIKAAVPSARTKRLHILYVINDVLATISPTEMEIPKKKLPVFDRTSTIYELKYYFTLLSQLAVSEPDEGTTTGPKPGVTKVIQDGLITNLTRRGIYLSQEGSDLSAKITAHDGKGLTAVMGELGLDQKIELPGTVLTETDIVLDRILPSHHVLPDHPNASWDTLPAMNGLFLKRIRGFPLRAGGLQNGLMLPNAGMCASTLATSPFVSEHLPKLTVSPILGKQSSAATKADMLATYATASRLTSRFTSAADIADIDPLGNVVYAEPALADSDGELQKKPRPRALNYAALVRDDIAKIRELETRFRQRALGYDGVPKLQSHDGPPGGAYYRGGGGGESDRGNGAAKRIDQDVERAMALARGDTERPPGGGRGGPMRGGFRGNFGGGGGGGGGGFRGGGGGGGGYGGYGGRGGSPAGGGFGRGNYGAERGDLRHGDRQY